MGKKNKKLNKRKKPAVVDPEPIKQEMPNMSNKAEFDKALQDFANLWKVHFEGTVSHADPATGEPFAVNVKPEEPAV